MDALADGLPDFLVIGAQKAGTSWFGENLAGHPDVFMAPREAHYFNRNHARGVDWYRAQLAGQAGERAVGEGTPCYLFDESTPARIRETLGSAVKVIVTLRHPVDRAYSGFWNALASGRLASDRGSGPRWRTITARVCPSSVTGGLHSRLVSVESSSAS